MRGGLACLAGIFVLVVFLLAPAQQVRADTVGLCIGVLANKGKPAAVSTWQPLVDYLGQAVPGYGFTLVPLDFDELYPAVEKERVDFVITNTGQYIELESYYGISRIATFRNAGPGGYHTHFGGVLFVRADHKGIHSIRDFPGHAVLAADERSFGGWLMQLREIKSRGVDPAKFKDLRFTGNHEAVVKAVFSGESDVGAVRTDILERMADRGEINLDQLRIINEQSTPGFPFRHSTPLYPEWPFAKSAHTDSAVAQRVAIALLSLPADSPAAMAAQSGGWTIPEDYSAVHELFRDLELGPYAGLGEFHAVDVLQKYWPVILLSLLLLLVTGTAAVRVSVANRRLETALTDLHQTHAALEKANGLLVESLQYARRIQNSLLPDPQASAGELAELALLWEPLDMVSGDYYWMGRVDGKTVVIVADCTGHGVPGAMLTMVVSASLDFILHRGGLPDPGRILVETDRAVRARLRQDTSDSASDDGLEMSVCVYNPDTGILSFAGAGLPLVWVRNGKAAVIRADRAGLGYRTWEPKEFFRVHRLAVEKGMTFYMFTDGITDMVGGSPKRLFGCNRLMDLVAGLDRLPLDEQIPAIREHLRFYRGEENVRDDMTLVGFRLK